MDRPSQPALPGALIPVLTLLRQKLERAFGERLSAVRLYGSWARGEQGPESDVNVAILVQGLTPAEMREVIGLATDSWTEAGQYLSAQPYDADYFARMVEREHPYFEAVQREGIPA